MCMNTGVSSDFVNPLSYFDSYDLSSCMFECEAILMNQTCGCRMYFHPGKFSNKISRILPTIHSCMIQLRDFDTSITPELRPITEFEIAIFSCMSGDSL